MAYQIPYDGNLTWLVDRTIFFCVHGSRCYGTSRPDSDYDFKGVTVPPREYRDGFLRVFEQAIIKEPDTTIFDVRKFFKLAADANPNIIELLYVNPDDIKVCTPAGRLLLDHRDEFLSQKASYTFRGYAISQLRRIKGHRRWLLSPPTQQPVREDFGLPQGTTIPTDQLLTVLANIQKKLDSWEIDFGELDEAAKTHIFEQVGLYLSELSIGSEEKFAAASRILGYSEDFIGMLIKEKQYRQALTEWQQYQEWKTNRNEKRADLEAKFGYDTKHGMHLVRLMRMCREILTEGKCFTRRPDAKELLSIRDGDWSYDRLIGWADEQDADLQEITKKSSLPKSPNRNKLDELCVEIVQSMPG